MEIPGGPLPLNKNCQKNPVTPAPGGDDNEGGKFLCGMTSGEDAIFGKLGNILQIGIDLKRLAAAATADLVRVAEGKSFAHFIAREINAHPGQHP